MIGKTENGSLYLRNRKHYPCFYTVIETRVQKFGRTGNNQWETGQYDEFFQVTLSSSKLPASVFVMAGFGRCDDWTAEYIDMHIRILPVLATYML
jgi:hypothetical protein